MHTIWLLLAFRSLQLWFLGSFHQQSGQFHYFKVFKVLSLGSQSFLHTGAEQAGDVMLPSVFFSRSLRKTLATVQAMIAAVPYDNIPHKVRSNCLIPHGLSHMLTVSSSVELLLGDLENVASQVQLAKIPVSNADATQPILHHDAEIIAIRTQDLQMGPNLNVELACPSLEQIDWNADRLAVKLLAHVNSGVTIRHAITENAKSNCLASVVLAIGPEGGWTEAEIKLWTDVHGFQTVTTAAGRTLDTTTAVIALVSSVTEALAEQH